MFQSNESTMRENDDPQLIPVARAAKRLGISRDTIDRLIKTEEVRVVKIGGRVMVPQMEVDRIVMGRTREAAQITASQPVRTRASSADSATVRNVAAATSELATVTDEEAARCDIFFGPNAGFWARVAALGDRRSNERQSK
jgi:excisionase family DNA binding protein